MKDIRICENCTKETTNPKYCSKSCAAIINNTKYPKRDRRTPCKCGNKISHTALMCMRCFKKEKLKIRNNKKLSEVSMKSNKWSKVREMARRYLEFLEIEKKCNVCNFNIVVEVAHIKPISNFSEDTLIGEVNHINNLIYLCPNHHAMFDKGLIKLN